MTQTTNLYGRLIDARLSEETAALALTVFIGWLREHRAQLGEVHADAGEFLEDMIGELSSDEPTLLTHDPGNGRLVPVGELNPGDRIWMGGEKLWVTVTEVDRLGGSVAVTVAYEGSEVPRTFVRMAGWRVLVDPGATT